MDVQVCVLLQVGIRCGVGFKGNQIDVLIFPHLKIPVFFGRHGRANKSDMGPGRNTQFLKKGLHLEEGRVSHSNL